MDRTQVKFNKNKKEIMQYYNLITDRRCSSPFSIISLKKIKIRVPFVTNYLKGIFKENTIHFKTLGITRKTKKENKTNHQGRCEEAKQGTILEVK